MKFFRYINRREEQRLRVGLSTASYFSRRDCEDALSSIVASGAPVCEVFLDTFCEYLPSFAQKLLERAQGCIDVHAVHAMSTQFEPQLFSINERQRSDAFALLDQVLSVGKLLQARCYVMHGPLLLMGAAKNLHLGRIVEAANAIAERCAGYGLRLSWENVSYCLFNEPDFPSRMERLGLHDNMGFTLDIKQAARRGHDPFDYLAAIGRRLVNLHVCDYSLEEGKLRLQMPLKGSFDFARLIKECRSVGYAGPMLVEVYSDMYGDESELAASVQALRTLVSIS